MPLEPNKNMDDLLKAHAKERREQADVSFELHPATRKLLQDEVKRTLGDEEYQQQTPRNLIAALWPRLAFAAGLAGLLVALVASFPWDARRSSIVTGSDAPIKMAASEAPALIPAAPAVKQGASIEAPRGNAIVQAGSFDALKEEKFVSDAKTAQKRVSTAQDGLAASPSDTMVARYDMEVANSGVPASTPAPTAAAPVTTLVPDSRLARRSVPASERHITMNSSSAVPSPAPAEPLKDKSSILATRLHSKSAESNVITGVEAGRQGVEGRGQAGVGGAARAFSGERVTVDADRSLYARTESAPSKSASAGVKQKALTFGAMSQGQNTYNRFVQINNRARYRENMQSPPLPKVLQSFSFEQSGQNIQIVDEDGSVYTGEITQAPRQQEFYGYGNAIAESPARKSGDQSSWAFDDLKNGAQGASNFVFTASGLNQRLNKNVVLRGTFQGTPPAPGQSTPGSNAGQLGVYWATTGGTNTLQNFSQQNSLQLQQSRISGRVQVGKDTEFNLEAEPAH